MLIECPNCARSYHISKASVVENGRKMRGASCREIWHVPAAKTPGADDPHRLGPMAPDEIIAGMEINAVATSERAAPQNYEELYGEPIAAPHPAPPRQTWKAPRPPMGLVLAVVMLAMGMGLVARREAVVRIFPASARVYAAIGLPVNLRGLELRRITSTLVGEGPQRVLAIEGEITNISRSAASVPELKLALKAADGREIYGWTANAPKSKLDAGETMQFRARLASPPDKARDLTVKFAPETAKVKEAMK